VADLRADCQSCFGLCCVALTFLASADFPVDKPAGEPCGHLSTAHRCGVHASLLERGYAGCVGYDCIGAGQRVSQVTFGGRDWRTHPDLAVDMFAALPIMRQLHELLAYLADARGRVEASMLHAQLDAFEADVCAVAEASADELLATDVDALRSRVAPVLREASRLVRAPFRGPDRAGRDLAGASLAGAELNGADLRGALLIGADLRGARLRSADLIGADLRGAQLGGADLSSALYVTQAQLNSARGDDLTALPAGLERPQHWRPESRARV